MIDARHTRWNQKDVRVCVFVELVLRINNINMEEFTHNFLQENHIEGWFEGITYNGNARF